MSSHPSVGNDSKERLKMNQPGFIIYLVLTVLFVAVMYQQTVKVLWGRWFEAGSYYQHAVGIPILSAWLFWRGRAAFAAGRQPSLWGIGIVVIAGVLHLISILLEFEVISAATVPLLLAGVFIHFFGVQVTRRFLFPIAILLLCIPMPTPVMDSLTLGLKLFAAQAADGIVHLLSVATVREGSIIYTPRGAIVVGDPCSGMQSIVTLVTVGIVYAYFKKDASLGQKAIFVIMALPIALAFNIIRLVLTIIIAQFFGINWLVNGLLHEGFGLIFVVAGFFTLTKIFQLMISRRRPRLGESGLPVEGVSTVTSD